jgi:hypothetical protein
VTAITYLAAAPAFAAMDHARLSPDFSPVLGV